MKSAFSVSDIRKKAQLTGHEASIFTLQPGREERYLLSGSGDGWIVEWDLENPEMGRLIARVETQVFSMAYLQDHNWLVAGNMNGGVHWVQLDDPDQTRNIAHHRKGVFDILLVGENVLTLGGQGLLTRWSAAEGRSLESIQLSRQSLRCCDYHPGRHELAIGASDNAIYFVDPDTLQVKSQRLNAHDNSIFCVRYSPDGKFLLSGGRDAHLRVWELDDLSEPHTSHPAHWFTINRLAWHPNGRWFATGSRDKTIKIWDGATFQLLKVLDTARDGGHINSVNALHWSSYQNLLISAGDDRSLIVWEY